jgi:hypothetical protein
VTSSPQAAPEPARTPYLISTALITIAGLVLAAFSGGSSAQAWFLVARLCIVGLAVGLVILRADRTPWSFQRGLLIGILAALAAFIVFQPLPISYRLGRLLIVLLVIVACCWTGNPLRSAAKALPGGRATLAALVVLEILASISAISTDVEAYVSAQRGPLQRLASGEPIDPVTASFYARGGLVYKNPRGQYVATPEASDIARATGADPWRFLTMSLARNDAGPQQCAIGLLSSPDLEQIRTPFMRSYFAGAFFHCDRLLGHEAAAQRVYRIAMAVPSGAHLPGLSACEPIVRSENFSLALATASDQRAILAPYGLDGKMLGPRDAAALLRAAFSDCAAAHRRR